MHWPCRERSDPVDTVVVSGHGDRHHIDDIDTSSIIVARRSWSENSVVVAGSSMLSSPEAAFGTRTLSKLLLRGGCEKVPVRAFAETSSAFFAGPTAALRGIRKLSIRASARFLGLTDAADKSWLRGSAVLWNSGGSSTRNSKCA